MSDIQNINLLSELPIKPQVKFSIAVILKLAGMFCLFLILFYVLVWSLTAQKKSTLDRLQAEKENVNREIKTLTTTRATANLVKKLPREFPHGFSSHLLALANITPYKVWLQNIVFSAENNYTLLSGKALAASFVTDFIDALAVDPTINGKFNILKINKDIDDKKSNKNKKDDKKEVKKEQLEKTTVVSFTLKTLERK